MTVAEIVARLRARAAKAQAHAEWYVKTFGADDCCAEHEAEVLRKEADEIEWEAASCRDSITEAAVRGE